MQKNHKKQNKKVIITAGPTIENIDPVRYISSRSSGTMGYLIAEAMRDKGFKVVLISGPVNISPPEGVMVICVKTAEEMNRAVKKEIKGSCCIVASAAVSDFKVQNPSKKKIKKKKQLTLKLVKNVDILAGLKEKKDLVKIGFALETENAVKNGQKKIKEKGLDLIIVNRLSKTENPFGRDKTKKGEKIKRGYYVLYRDGSQKRFEGISKKSMSVKIVCEAEKCLREK